MPCMSYEPSANEVESDKICNFLEEFKQSIKNRGVHTLDEDAAQLCSLCQKVDITKYSLELQIWWRDHQKADKKRIEKEINNKKKAEEKELALSKLTAYERKLLGL